MATIATTAERLGTMDINNPSHGANPRHEEFCALLSSIRAHQKALFKTVSIDDMLPVAERLIVLIREMQKLTKVET